MAIDIIVEDGSLIEGANSYVDLAFADAYLASRGSAAWAEAPEDIKAAALIRAADVLNGYRWKGQPMEPGRIMAWPRTDMEYSPGNPVSERVIPVQVQNAQCEISGNIVTEKTDPLAPVDVSQGAVTLEKVDVIQVEYAEPNSNVYTGKTGYLAVDALLRPFLCGGFGRFGIVDMGRG